MFPEDVQSHVGYALYGAQCGEEYASVKALKALAAGPCWKSSRRTTATHTVPYTP